MGLVAAKCAQCGADIEVDESRESGYCPHCGTKYITEKVIHNTYNTVNNTTNNTVNIGQATFISQGENSLQFLREKFEAYFKLDDSDKIVETAEEMLKKYPQAGESHLCKAYAEARAAAVYYNYALAHLGAEDGEIMVSSYMGSAASGSPAALAERVVDSVLRQDKIALDVCERVINAAVACNMEDEGEADKFFASLPDFLYDDEEFGNNILVGAACVCGNARMQKAREEVEKADRLQAGTDVDLLQRAADKIAEAEKLYAQLEAGIRSGAIAAVEGLRKASGKNGKGAKPKDKRKIIAYIFIAIAAIAFAAAIIGFMS